MLKKKAGFTPLEKHYIFNKWKHFILQIFSNLQYKKQKHSLTGFTLLEVVVSIVLFTILSCFLMAIVPSLIVKFRASAFKEQTIYLAKSKLEEYIYTTLPESVAADSETLEFPSPYNKFWYRVIVDSYSSGSNVNLVTVRAWGPTSNKNNTTVNAVNLVALAKSYEEPQAQNYSFLLPSDVRPYYPGNTANTIRIYYDSDTNQVILHKIPVNWNWRDPYSYPIRSYRYNLDGSRKTLIYNEDPKEYFFGWAYNPALKKLLGIITWPFGSNEYFTPYGYVESNSTSSATRTNWHRFSIPGKVYYRSESLVNTTDALACAYDGTTYLIKKTGVTIATGSGHNYQIQVCKVWISELPTSSTIATACVPVAKTSYMSYSGEGANIGWSPYQSCNFAQVLSTIGFPTELTNIRVDKENKVLLSVFEPQSSTVIECDKYLTTGRILFPPKTIYTSDGIIYRISSDHIERDKYNNIYVMPVFMEKKNSSGGWDPMNIKKSNSNYFFPPWLRFKETGRDAKGNAVLTYTGKATDKASVLDFKVSPDGKKLITVEGKTSYPGSNPYNPATGVYVNVYGTKP